MRCGTVSGKLRDEHPLRRVPGGRVVISFGVGVIGLVPRYDCGRVSAVRAVLLSLVHRGVVERLAGSFLVLVHSHRVVHSARAAPARTRSTPSRIASMTRAIFDPSDPLTIATSPASRRRAASAAISALDG